MAQDKTWINGLFITKRNGQYGEFLSIGVKKEEFIDQLMELKEDEDGFVNFTSNPQKNDPSKFSTSLNTWKPSKPAAKKSSGKKASEPVELIDTTNGSDDLPF